MELTNVLHSDLSQVCAGALNPPSFPAIVAHEGRPKYRHHLGSTETPLVTVNHMLYIEGMLFWMPTRCTL